MQNTTNTIFCDEAGFTGNDLYSPEQPYFVYSSVLIDPIEAREIVQKVRTDFRLQMQELKGSKLLRTKRGKRAILWLLENYSTKASVVIFDKKYSLAGKFFEYVFEPVLAPQSSLFYNALFHRFVSNILYLHLLTQETYAEQLILDFQACARELDFTPLENSLSALTSSDLTLFMQQISTFALLHKNTIIHELHALRNNPAMGNWVLELSITALHGLLANWGEEMVSMKVYCDDSKPIFSQSYFFDVMINRKDRQYLQIGPTRYPLTYNLTDPIQLVNSKNHAGIQLADVFASSMAYSLKEDNEFSTRYHSICDDMILSNSVFPQLEYADLEQPQGYVNALILQELVERSLRGEDLFEGMNEYIGVISLAFPEWREHYNSKVTKDRS